MTLRGANNAAPVGGNAFRAVNDGYTASVVAPSVTSPAAAHLLLTAHLSSGICGAYEPTYTYPTGMTELADVTDTNSAWGLEVCSLAVGAGATGTKTATRSNTAAYQVGGALLIAPAAPSARGLFGHNF